MTEVPAPKGLTKEQSFKYPPNAVVSRVESMSEVLNVESTLGFGMYSTVKKCLVRDSKQEWAVKVIDENTYLSSKKQVLESTLYLRFPFIYCFSFKKKLRFFPGFNTLAFCPWSTLFASRANALAL